MAEAETHDMPPRLLILGGGAVVSEYYAPALDTLGWQAHALVVDPSQPALEAIRHMDASLRCEARTFEDVLGAAGIADSFDAAIVALPNSMHEHAMTLALERGLAVLCEKPLAMSSEACCRLAQLAHARGKTLAVGMVRRVLPSVEVLQQALAEKLIGELVRIEVQDGEPYAWLSDSGAFFRPENGGVLADMGVHYLDILEELCGPLTPRAYADDWRGGVEANVDFDLCASSGVPVHLELSRTRRLANALVCHGTRGRLSIAKDAFDRCVWRADDARSSTVLMRDEPGAATLQDAFRRQLLDFAASIQGGTPPRVSAERAATTIRLLEWAYAHHGDSKPTTDWPKPTKTPRIVITGGTGFIGSHLIERLHATSDSQVVAPVRNYRTCAEIARYPVHTPRLDLLDRAAVRKVVCGARHVFHLAYGRDGENAERITIDGTRNVIEAAIAEGCECVVVLSTIYVFGQPDRRVDESWRYAPVGGAYGRTKMQMEQWCLDRAKTAGTTRVVVLNPGCVYGPRGATYTELPSRLAGQRAFCLVNGGIGTVNYTYVGNLVDAVLAAATSTAAHGQRFIVCDGETTWRDFFDQLLGRSTVDRLPSYTHQQLHQMHRNRPRPGLRDIARTIVGEARVRSAVRESRIGELALKSVDRVAPRLLRGIRTRPQRPDGGMKTMLEQAPMPPEWLADLFGPTTTIFDSDKAARVLGWTPRVSLSEGMQHTRRWLLEAGLSAT